jgi:hypothetical protein
MGSIHTYNPDGGPALPELPPISIGALAVGLTDLLGRAGDLPQPGFVGIFSGSEHISLQFDREPASARTVALWARRFGSAVTEELHEDGRDGPEQWVRTDFDFYGVHVCAYAHIPISTGDQQ